MQNTKPYVVYMTSQPQTLAIDPASQGDPFYRYKTRQLSVQTIGNGKMIRTSFTNLDDVAKDLKIPPPYIPHYMAKSIGAQAKYDGKKPAMQRGTISGEYPVNQLSDLLIKFIREFVLCPQCRLPELDYGVRKDAVRARCRGCGWKGKLEAVETNEKFRRFVLNNPPPKPQKMAPKKAGSAPRSKPAQNGDSKPRKGAGPQQEGVVWLSDTSEEASQQRLEQIPDRLKELVATGEGDEVPEAEASPTDHLKAFVQKKPAPTSDEVLAEVARLRAEHALDKKGVTQLIFGALLADLPSMKANIAAHKKVFAEHVGSDPLIQAVFLACFEDKIKEEKNQKKREAFVAKEAVLVLKQCYDLDVLEEDTILQWFDTRHPEDKLRKAVEPFTVWLREAEEEDSDDEEDAAEEDENAPPAKEAAAAPKEATPAAAQPKPVAAPSAPAPADLDDAIDAL